MQHNGLKHSTTLYYRCLGGCLDVFGCVLSVFWLCLGVLGVFWVCFECVLGVFGCALGVFGCVLGMFECVRVC